MNATQIEYEPGAVGNETLAILACADLDDGMTIRQIADQLFPKYKPVWIRETLRRMDLAGLVTIDHSVRPARVRLPGRLH